VSFFHLPVRILEKIGFISLSNADAGIRRSKPGCVPSGVQPFATGFHTNQFNRIIRKESYEALVKKMKRKLEETPS